MKKTALGILIASIIIAVLPLLSMIAAGLTASLFGCDLNEGDVSMCPTIFGDIGELLYTMGVFGWFLFYTVPLGAVGLVTSAILFIIAFIRNKARTEKPHDQPLQ